MRSFFGTRVQGDGLGRQKSITMLFHLEMAVLNSSM